MLSLTELRNIAEARLGDAEILFAAGRLDGAFYLYGYAIELALKARICLTLGWSGYPSTNYEFQNYQSFRTHDLDVLLHLSGVESFVKSATSSAMVSRHIVGLRNALPPDWNYNQHGSTINYPSH